MPEQQTYGTYYFKVDLGGAEAAGFFKECTGLSSTNAVVAHTSTDANGKSLVQKFPGQLEWQNITLKRGVDAKADLWKWRQDIIDGKIDDSRKNGTIELVDWKGTAVITYAFVRGWPCKYAAPGMNAGGNEILVEEIEIAHEGFSRQ